MIDAPLTPDSYDASEGVRRRVAGRDRKLIAKVWKMWAPPVSMTVSEWAQKNRVMADGATSEPGGYNPDRLPWQRFIQDQITNLRYNRFTLCGASQTTGKTEMLNNVIGYFIDHDPSAIIVAYPSKDSADSWSKKKLVPMIESTPALRRRIGDPRSRDGGNTISYKKFPGGWIGVVGKNSPNKLRQQSARITIDDEKDGDKASSGDEGDASDLLANRSESFSNSVYIGASTPTIAGQSKIWRDLEVSDWHVWECKCQKCGEYQELKWSQLQWDTDKDEHGKITKHHPKTARYVCAHCGEHWNDIDRQRAITAGRARATRPENEDFGFHQNGLYKMIGGKTRDGSMLVEFAKKFLKAQKNGREALKVWTNTFLCEPFSEDFEKLDEKAVAGRAEDYDPDVVTPAGVLRVEVGADVQEDRIEMEFVGYGEGEETWGLGYHVLHGDTQANAVWEQLDALLAKTFAHPSGKALGVTSAFIDSGARQDRVMQFTGPRRSRGIFASKGYNSPGKPVPILGRRPSINNKKKIPQWIVGVTAAKTVIYSRIMAPVPGPGSMHFPKGHGYDARYFRQLTSEKRMTRYSHGRPYYIYEAGDRRNEPLDIRVYALAAHRRTPFDSVKLKQELSASPPCDSPGQRVKSENPSKASPLQSDWRAGMEPAQITPSAAPLLSASPTPPASAPRPAYVPMSQRFRGGGGATLFKG